MLQWAWYSSVSSRYYHSMGLFVLSEFIFLEPENDNFMEVLLEMRQQLGWINELPRHGPGFREKMAKLQDKPRIEDNVEVCIKDMWSNNKTVKYIIKWSICSIPSIKRQLHQLDSPSVSLFVCLYVIWSAKWADRPPKVMKRSQVCFIIIGGRSVHLACHVHKSGRKTSIIIIIYMSLCIIIIIIIIIMLEWEISIG